MPRTALEAVIDCDGTPLRVVTTHLSHQSVRQRRVQVDEIWSFTYAKQKNVATAKAAPADAVADAGQNPNSFSY